MTVSDLLHLPTGVQLPSLASDPRVRVLPDLEVDRLESCEQCAAAALQTDIDYEAADIPVGTMRLTYHLREGGPEWHTDLCGPDCAQTELDEVLNLHNCVGVRLHIQPPSRFIPAMRCPDDDPRYVELAGLRQGIARMRNDADRMSGPEGFEAARERALTYVQALIDDRVEQLRRAA